MIAKNKDSMQTYLSKKRKLKLKDDICLTRVQRVIDFQKPKILGKSLLLKIRLPHQYFINSNYRIHLVT